MAEIRIQRKRRAKVWPWLLGAAVLILLLLVPLLSGRDRRAVPTTAAITPDTVVPPAIVPAAPLVVGSTTGAIDTARRPDTAGRVTSTAAGAVAPSAPVAAAPDSPAVPTAAPAPTTAPAPTAFARHVAAPPAAADERVQRRYTAEGLRRLADELRTLGASAAGVRTIRRYADSVGISDARRPRAADQTRTAFVAAVHELDVLRARHSAPVDTGRLRSRAWAVRPDRRLAPQRGQVQAFFESANDALLALPRRQ